MKQDHQDLWEKWCQDKEKDAIREANTDELRLQELEMEVKNASTKTTDN